MTPAEITQRRDEYLALGMPPRAVARLLWAHMSRDDDKLLVARAREWGDPRVIDMGTPYLMSQLAPPRLTDGGGA